MTRKIKDNLHIICLAGLFIVLQGCCFDGEEVDVYFSNKTSEPIWVHMQSSKYVEGDIVGTMGLYARPWSYDKLAPDSTYVWRDNRMSNNGLGFVIIRQSTINRYDSTYLTTHCLYDSIFYLTMSQLNDVNYRIEYKGKLDSVNHIISR